MSVPVESAVAVTADPNVAVFESTPAPDAPQSERAKARAERAAAAAAEQDAIDAARGYREIEWKPNVWLFQSLTTQHTEAAEADMIAHVAATRAGRPQVAPPKGTPFS